MNTISITDRLTQKVRDSTGTNLAQRLLRAARRCTFKSFTSQARAREIMNRNFFGVEEATKYFRVTPSKRELALLTDVPFSEKTLYMCARTHILIAVFPLSILDIRRVDPKLFSSTHFDIVESVDVHMRNVLLKGQRFANNRGKVGWHLARKDHVPDSDDLSWWWQRMFLGVSQKVPTARVLIYSIIGYYLLTGRRLLTGFPFARCADRLSFSRGVAISNWGEGDHIGYAPGIHLSSFSRFFSCERLGVASERRR